jgi:S1-C subfamily serine protease
LHGVNDEAVPEGGVTVPFLSAAMAAWRAAHGVRPDDWRGADPHPSVVKLSIKALPGARTGDTLGTEREGTGIIIDASGLILTIGYLVLEADSILVIGADGSVLPAHVVGFDHATGFGLARVSQRPSVEPVELGDSAGLAELERVQVATHAGAGGSTWSYVVSRRRFVGYWEYMIDDAIFTAPARFEHSGAALLDGAGRLVGIASLWVGDALDSSVAFPGNMFVPIDLLKPLLADLAAGGRSRTSRPWLGVYTEQVKGHVVVTRVLPESPAESAGMAAGDVILGVEASPVGDQGDFYRKLWAAGAAGSDVSLNVLHGKNIRKLIVKSVDRVEWLRPRPVY